MDYRMGHRDRQQFLARTRAFSNEIINDDNDYSIPDFWEECGQKDLIGPMTLLRREGRRDVYGMCSPAKGDETHFYYEIGVIIDEDTDTANLGQFTVNGYSVWKTVPADYAVFKCFGSDGNCLGETWEKFYKEFSPQTGYVQTDDTGFDIYFEKGESGLFCELWIPVRKS